MTTTVLLGYEAAYVKLRNFYGLQKTRNAVANEITAIKLSWCQFYNDAINISLSRCSARAHKRATNQISMSLTLYEKSSL